MDASFRLVSGSGKQFACQACGKEPESTTPVVEPTPTTVEPITNTVQPPPLSVEPTTSNDHYLRGGDYDNDTDQFQRWNYSPGSRLGELHNFDSYYKGILDGYGNSGLQRDGEMDTWNWRRDHECCLQ